VIVVAVALVTSARVPRAPAVASEVGVRAAVGDAG
jgi:hypothetical protein